MTSTFDPLLVLRRQRRLDALTVEGVLEHWNLRCLVNLIGKVLWPGSRIAAFGRGRALVTKTSLAVWALHVIMPNKPAHVHVREISHPGSYQHNHSYQRRHQTPLVHEDISSFLFNTKEPVTSEERPPSLPPQACRISAR
jgi:hypothetical protein